MKRLILFLLTVLTIAQVIYVITGLVANPFATGDAYAIWYLKAVAISHGGYPLIAYSHPEYPWLWPLFLALLGNNERLYRWLSPLVFMGIVWLSYRLVAEKRGLFWGATAAFSASSVMALERLGGRGEVGFADLPLALSFLLGFYVAFKKKVNYPLLGLVWAMAANIKIEGLLGALLFALIFRPKNKTFWLIFLPLTLCWPVVAWKLGLKTIYGDGLSLFAWSRLPTVAELLVKSLADFGRFGLWPIIGGFSFIIARTTPWLKKAQFWLVAFLGLIAFSYLFTPLDIKGHWEVSFYRIIVQVLPIIISTAIYSLSLLMA